MLAYFIPYEYKLKGIASNCCFSQLLFAWQIYLNINIVQRDPSAATVYLSKSHTQTHAHRTAYKPKSHEYAIITWMCPVCESDASEQQPQQQYK